MKRKLLVITLAVMMVFVFSAIPVSAASKQVVQVSEKDYNIEDGKEVLNWSYNTTYENGRTSKTAYKSIWYNYDYNEETGEETKTKASSTNEFSYKYKNGLMSKEFRTTDGKKSGKTLYFYNKKKLSKSVSYDYKNGKYVKASTTTYKRTSKKVTVTTKYENGDPEYKSVQTLNSKGNVTKIVTYRGGKKEGTETNTYYSNGFTKKSVYKSTDGETSYTNYYNKKGQTTKSIDVYSDSKYVYEYTYNSKGLVTKRTEKYTYIDWEGNKQTENYTFTYKYSNFYNSNKAYPKTVKIYRDGEYWQKEVKGYKKIALK